MNINIDSNLSGLIIGFFNFVAAMMNLYFGLVVKKSQADKVVISSLRDQLEIKTETIKDLSNEFEKKEKAIDELMDRKNEYKRQFQTQLLINEKLQGELITYKKLHNQLEMRYDEVEAKYENTN